MSDAIDLLSRPERTHVEAWGAQQVDVGHLAQVLIARGWKVDTEDSDILQALSRTWRAEGVKVWLALETAACAPPDHDQSAIASLCFYRFDPSRLPERSIYRDTYDPGDEDEPWFAGHREDHRWIIDNGDPNFRDEHLMTAAALGAVPEAIRRAVAEDLAAAIVPAAPRRGGRLP